MAASLIDDKRVLPGKLDRNPSAELVSLRSLDAIPIMREFLRSIYTKHSAAFVQVMQTLAEPLRAIVTKHLQAT